MLAEGFGYQVLNRLCAVWSPHFTGCIWYYLLFRPQLRIEYIQGDDSRALSRKPLFLGLS